MRDWINLFEYKDASVSYICWIGDTRFPSKEEGYFIVGDAEKGQKAATLVHYKFVAVYEARFSKVLWMRSEGDENGIELRELSKILGLTEQEYIQVLNDPNYDVREDEMGSDNPWCYGVDLLTNGALLHYAAARGYDALIGSNSDHPVVEVLDFTRIRKVDDFPTKLGPLSQPKPKPGRLF